MDWLPGTIGDHWMIFFLPNYLTGMAADIMMAGLVNIICTFLVGRIF